MTQDKSKDTADQPDETEQADTTLQVNDDTAAYGTYEAENFGPEGDASKN